MSWSADRAAALHDPPPAGQRARPEVNGVGGPALRDARTPGHSRRLPPGVQRARREFALRLIAEVRASLEEPTPQALEQELADLELLEYCRPYLKRRG